MAVHVIQELDRCLNCKKPRCVEGCPIHTPIPQIIQTLKQGKLNEAGAMLFANNPLTVMCSYVCNYENQCEGHCIKGIKDKPVHFNSIENYVSDAYLDKLKINCAPKNGIRVAVIGSGPAGLTVAIKMAQKGYGVTVFESRSHVGGMLYYGIPDFRLPRQRIAKLVQKMSDAGIQFRVNTTIGGALEIRDLFHDDYKAVFIGTGVWRPNKLGVHGESLGNVHFAIDYLAAPAAQSLGETVIIIGMGNSAMDVARVALRNGTNRVIMVTHGLTSAARSNEMAYAQLDGAEFEYGWRVTEITENGPVFRKIQFDEQGNQVGLLDETWAPHADSTVIAISQGPKDKLVNTTSGLAANERGLLVTDDRGHTSVEGIFAAGDVVMGARTVVEAVNQAKNAAEAMDEYIRSLKQKA